MNLPFVIINPEWAIQEKQRQETLLREELLQEKQKEFDQQLHEKQNEIDNLYHLKTELFRKDQRKQLYQQIKKQHPQISQIENILRKFEKMVTAIKVNNKNVISYLLPEIELKK